MLRLKMVLLVAAAAGSMNIAHAQVYRVTYTATAETPVGIIGGVNPSTVTSSIKAGDKITAQVEYDIKKASVTSLYDADPSVNIYSIPMKYSYSVGGYNSGVQSVSDGYLQIWNDRFISSYSPHVDAYSFGNLYRYLPVGTSPVSLGNGVVFSGLSLNAFNDSGSKLSSDLIKALPSYDGWNVSMELSFLNVGTSDFALIRASNVQASVSEVTGVPEPEAWCMLIFGFSAIGYAKRRRPRAHVFPQ